jgi:EAL and modified HD-GYP domain-containing signal transduction protein
MIATTESSVDLSTSEIFLARNSVFDRSGRVMAYEMLFRSRESVDEGRPDDLATSTQVIVNSMSHFGLEGVLGSADGFIHVTEKLLMSNTLEILPAQRIILEIMPDVSFNMEMLKRLQELKTAGFRIALVDSSLSDVTQAKGAGEGNNAILPLVDIIKVKFIRYHCCFD